LIERPMQRTSSRKLPKAPEGNRTPRSLFEQVEPMDPPPELTLQQERLNAPLFGFIQDLGLPRECANTLLSHKVTVDILLEDLSREDLKESGLALGHRAVLWRALCRHRDEAEGGVERKHSVVDVGRAHRISQATLWSVSSVNESDREIEAPFESAVTSVVSPDNVSCQPTSSFDSFQSVAGQIDSGEDFSDAEPIAELGSMPMSGRTGAPSNLAVGPHMRAHRSLPAGTFAENVGELGERVNQVRSAEIDRDDVLDWM